jgi:hypothetical protein
MISIGDSRPPATCSRFRHPAGVGTWALSEGLAAAVAVESRAAASE